jgi:hypothetical protein
MKRSFGTRYTYAKGIHLVAKGYTYAKGYTFGC